MTKAKSDRRIAVRIDPVIHEPARLQIVTVLSGVDWTDFPSLCRDLGVDAGQLVRPLRPIGARRLYSGQEEHHRQNPAHAVPADSEGTQGLNEYWAAMEQIRRMATHQAKEFQQAKSSMSPPAQAGVQDRSLRHWIPAFAGTTRGSLAVFLASEVLLSAPVVTGCHIRWIENTAPRQCG